MKAQIGGCPRDTITEIDHRDGLSLLLCRDASVSRDSLDSSRGRHQRDYKGHDHPRDHFKQTYHYRSDNLYHHRRDVNGDRPMAISRRDNYRSGTSSYSGCYNCGLNNHNQSTCFHKERLRCNFCNCLDHKSNYCTERNSRY